MSYDFDPFSAAFHPSRFREIGPAPYNGRMFFHASRTAVTLVTAAMLAFAGPGLVAPSSAFADGGDTGASVSELQQRVEQTAAASDESAQKVADIQNRIDENNARIEQINSELPEQKRNAAEALEALYKRQNQSSGLLDMFFSITNLDDLIKTTDYLNTIQQRNVDAINALNASEAELAQKSDQLASDKQAAEEQQAAAQEAAAQAVAAREEAQRQAEEQAAQEAAAQAAQAAAQASASASAAASSSSSGSSQSAESAASSSQAASGSSASDSSSAASSSAASDGGTTAAVSSGGVDWSIGKDAFISTWTARIDAYLAGSALAGQGRTFATAAWTYGVDPRWSPAIAYTESSLGAACFLPYNAWGWGSSSWGSWEEAIYAHVAGLAHGYGATISISAAQKYCPPNWQNWYNTTLAQMNAI